MWCRPEPSSVSPIYMPGRLRTASRPLRTLMESAPYSGEGAVCSVMKTSAQGPRADGEEAAVRPPVSGAQISASRSLRYIGILAGKASLSLLPLREKVGAEGARMRGVCVRFKYDG